jgi:SNF2 family DNA or RNA helicase
VDEAHLMKNAHTQGARCVKALKADHRLALSGTPVENRLEDLRSLFDFVFPGSLGSPKDFTLRYRKPIELHHDEERAEQLRRITTPFLLRRLNTDRTIIRDLPEKITVNHYPSLGKVQAALYHTVIDRTLRLSAQREEGETRSDLVLPLLTALKQICDHPRVYDKESPPLARLSGKAELLLTLLPEILANSEKVLVFSQYVETLECLKTIIAADLGIEAALYHGGLSQEVRAKLVDRFQNSDGCPILLVSLRAGGLGLNLTRASQVIHYDLWYNPAVENQATDRAFRIGQERRVLVHRFVTKNTFEERVDQMLTEKQHLADLTVNTGETWLARMSHRELAELFG